MTIARRFIDSVRRLGTPDAEEFDSIIVYAVVRTRHAEIDGRDWGPMSGRAQRACDGVRRDFAHSSADEAPSVPAETVTLELADYRRGLVATVIVHSIRRMPIDPAIVAAAERSLEIMEAA